MNLLDTHTLVWAINDPGQLPPAARRVIDDSHFMVSSASLWEMIIKKSRPTALVADPLSWWRTYISRAGIQILPITQEHIEYLDLLPGPNRDPFDRIMMCQCVVNRLRFVTRDEVIRNYYQGHLSCIW